ncbi:MAG: FAD:protein FMN transferase, partial [Albidovulum sp.]
LAEGGEVPLRARALATSAPLGTVFDAAGKAGHILHPVTGEPAARIWRAVSVSAPSAALADALSTAACLIPTRKGIDDAIARFTAARCESAVAA